MFTFLQISPDTIALERVFGSAARMAADNAAPMESMLPLTGNAVYKLILFVLFVGYCFVSMAYGGETGRMFKLICSPNLSNRINDCNNRSYTAALKSYSSIGIVAMSLATVKIIEMNGTAFALPVSPLFAVPLAILALSVVFLTGSAIVHGICLMTENGEFGYGLLTIFSTVFSLFTAISAPLILLFALNATGLSTVIYVIFTTLAAIAVTVLVLKTLIFFAEQKISILFWFLYLCAVLALPIGTLTTLIVRATIAR